MKQVGISGVAKMKAVTASVLLMLFLALVPARVLAQESQTITGEQGTSISVVVESKSSNWFSDLFKTYSIIPPDGLAVGGTFQDTLEFWGAANIKADKIKIIITKSSGATYDVYTLSLSSQQKSDLAVAGRYVTVLYNFKAPSEIGTYTLRANVVDSTGKYLGIYDLSNEFRVRSQEAIIPVKCQPAVCDDVWSFFSNIEGGRIEKQDCRWYETSTCKIIKTTTSKRTICSSGYDLIYGTCVKIQTPPLTPKTCTELGGDNYCIQQGYASCSSNTGSCEGKRETGTCEEVGGTCRGYIGPLSGCTGSEVKVDAGCGTLQNCCKTPSSVDGGGVGTGTGGTGTGTGGTGGKDVFGVQLGSIPSVDDKVIEASAASILKSVCLDDDQCKSKNCDGKKETTDYVDEVVNDRMDSYDSSLGKIFNFGFENPKIGQKVETSGKVWEKDTPITGVCVEKSEPLDFNQLFKDNQTAIIIGGGILGFFLLYSMVKK